MTSVDTRWMSIQIPDRFRGSLDRAEIVLDSVDNGSQIRVVAVRKDPPYSVTMTDAKDFAVGGDKKNPWTYEERSIGDHLGYFSSRNPARHFFSTVVGETLTMISADGFDRRESESAFKAVLAGLTIHPIEKDANKAEMATPRKPSDQF